MASSTISYYGATFMRQKVSSQYFPARSHQPVEGDAGFSSQLRQSVSGDAASAVAPGAAAEERHGCG